MGNLFIVATPIGNLDDITFRALKVLKDVDLIACEDTRHTKKLLTHFDIHKPLISYFQGKEEEKIGSILSNLKEGKQVALVSDAGSPAISDPGFKLVRAAVEAGVRVIPIPGASAVISALSVSGLPTDQFTFVGFLNDKEGKRRSKLEELKNFKGSLIFYVSKWKAEKVLRDMHEILGDRRAALCRELTKVFEEVRRGRISELCEYASKTEIKGELTLVVEGNEIV